MPDAPPVNKKISSNLLKFQINLIINKIEIIAVIWGSVIWINFCIGLAPSTSAASYKLCGIACNLAKIKRKANGKYVRQIPREKIWKNHKTKFF